jgi:F-type H+-transporting ATPase subunit delta
MEQLMARKIASRYAKAIFDAAVEEDKLDIVIANILSLQRIYLEVPSLNRFFSDPTIPVAEKQSLIEGKFKKGMAPMVGSLLTLLLESDRIGLLPEITTLFMERVQQKEGIAKADVTVPVAMSDKLEKKLRTTLEKLFDYQQVELNVKVDPAILAGAIVRIGDVIIDGSYHGKLEMLRRQVG